MVSLITLCVCVCVCVCVYNISSVQYCVYQAQAVSSCLYISAVLLSRFSLPFLYSLLVEVKALDCCLWGCFFFMQPHISCKHFFRRSESIAVINTNKINPWNAKYISSSHSSMLRTVGSLTNMIRMAPPYRLNIGSPSRHTIPVSAQIILQICLAVLCSVCPPAFFIFTCFILCLITAVQELIKIPMFISRIISVGPTTSHPKSGFVARRQLKEKDRLLWWNKGTLFRKHSLCQYSYIPVNVTVAIHTHRYDHWQQRNSCKLYWLSIILVIIWRL